MYLEMTTASKSVYHKKQHKDHLIPRNASTWQPVQLTLYHQEACEALDEDSLLELCDWGYRKLLSLNAKHHKQARGEPGHASRNMMLNSRFNT